MKNIIVKTGTVRNLVLGCMCAFVSHVALAQVYLQGTNFEPNSGCSGTEITYRLGTGSGTLSSVGFTVDSGNSSSNIGQVGSEYHFRVTWTAGGRLTATYKLDGGSDQQKHIDFTSLQISAGTISGATNVCSGANSGSLSVSGNTSAVTWQLCTSNCHLSNNWSNTTSSYTNLSVATQYRVRLNSPSCDKEYSAIHTITVQTPPQSFLFSGPQSALCPSASGTLHLQDSETGVTYRLYKDGNSSASTAGTGEALEWPVSIAGDYYVVTELLPCTIQSSTVEVEVLTSNGHISVTPTIANLCSGENVVLTASEGTNFSWSSSPSGYSASTAQVTVSPTQSTVYTVVGTPTHCPGQTGDEKTVTVNVRPRVSAVNPPSGLLDRCAGAVELGEYTTSGTEADYFTWEVRSVANHSVVGCASYSGLGTPATVSLNSGFTGTAVIIVTGHGCGNSTNVDSVYVTSKQPVTPMQVTGTAALCDGENNAEIVLASSETGVSYSLYLSGNLVDAPKAGDHTTPAAVKWTGKGLGSYSVKGSRDGCSPINMITADETGVWVVGVKPPSDFYITPSLPGAIFCEGSQELQLEVFGGHTLLWTSDHGIIENTQTSNPVIDVNTTHEVTSYTVVGQDNNCSTAKSKTIGVTMKRRPRMLKDIDTLSVHDGETAVIPLVPEGDAQGLSYEWTVSPGNVLGPTPSGTQMYHPYSIEQQLIILGNVNQDAVYTVTPYRYSCVGDSATITVTVKQALIQDPFNDQDKNYIITDILQRPELDVSTVPSMSTSDAIRSIGYFDGLGRPQQSVGMQASPSHKDIVTPNVHDKYGREFRKYLPITTTEGILGWYKENILNSHLNYAVPFYSDTTDNIADDIPYAETLFEQSPLSRVKEQGAPGADWQIGHNTIERDYLFNGATDVYRFSFDHQTKQLQSPTYYAANTLLQNKTTDEDDNEVLEFVDLQQRVVCKKVKVDNETYATTYYVYDDFGHLVVVLPPEAVKQIVDSLNN